MFTWYTAKNNRIERICQTGDHASPPGDEWQEAPNDWNGNPGDDLAWFNDTMHRIPDNELVEEGIRKDNRGLWYSKAKPGETKHVYNLDEEGGEEWTREAPIENEPYQKWDGVAGTWVIDETAREKAQIQKEIGEARGELSAGDYKVTKAAEKGLTLEELYPGETAKRDALRTKINTLEARLSEFAA
jgi:hypothetical protein